jgi:hypothetical protein
MATAHVSASDVLFGRAAPTEHTHISWNGRQLITVIDKCKSDVELSHVVACKVGNYT